MLPRRKILAIAVALAGSGACQAQTTAEEDELALAYGDKGFVSIATGSRQAVRRAPAVATVITAEDIAAMGAIDLDEVMEAVPGIHVNRTANNYSSLYAVRGITSFTTPQVLVLQNGIPITTLYQGNKGSLWGGYPVENIARIEVIRGPGSALYGADAYSGVINITTKTAADTPGTRFGVRGGSFNTWDSWIQHGGKLGAVDVAAYLRVGSTDGFRRTVEADAQSTRDTPSSQSSLAPGPVNTGRDAVDANLDLGYGKWRLHAGYKLRDNLETGAGIASALDPVGRGRSERVTADLGWADPQVTANWGLSFTASYLHYSQQMPVPYQLSPPGTDFGTGVFSNGMIGAPETWESQVRVSGHATYSGFADHRLRFGLGHDDLDLYRTRELRNFTYAANGLPIPLANVTDFSNSGPFMLPHRRQVDYFYAQDEWSFARDWTLTAGLRRDSYSDFGGTNNPRLALVWDASYAVTAKLLYGRAFRAPAFIETYGITNPVARGNPDLVPETISTTEAALAWRLSRETQVNLTVFRYLMHDIIRTVSNPVAGTGSTYANTGSQRGHGGEVEVVWDGGGQLRLTGHYAFQRSTDAATHTDAGYAPHHHLYGRADWRFAGGWLASAQANYVADRKRAAGDTRPAIPDYTSVDLSLMTERKAGNWNFAATVRNLFDADVREPSQAPGTALPNDLPMPGRALYLQAIYQL